MSTVVSVQYSNVVHVPVTQLGSQGKFLINAPLQQSYNYQVAELTESDRIRRSPCTKSIKKSIKPDLEKSIKPDLATVLSLDNSGFLGIMQKLSDTKTQQPV